MNKLQASSTKHQAMMERTGLMAHTLLPIAPSAFELRKDKHQTKESPHTGLTTSSIPRCVEPHLNMRHPDFRDPLLDRATSVAHKQQASACEPRVDKHQTKESNQLQLTNSSKPRRTEVHLLMRHRDGALPEVVCSS